MSPRCYSGFVTAWELTRRGHRVVLIDRTRRRTGGFAEPVRGHEPPARRGRPADSCPQPSSIFATIRGSISRVQPPGLARVGRADCNPAHRISMSGLVRCGVTTIAETVGEAGRDGRHMRFGPQLKHRCANVLSRTELLRTFAVSIAVGPLRTPDPKNTRTVPPGGGPEYASPPSRMLTRCTPFCVTRACVPSSSCGRGRRGIRMRSHVHAEPLPPRPCRDRVVLRPGGGHRFDRNRTVRLQTP